MLKRILEKFCSLIARDGGCSDFFSWLNTASNTLPIYFVWKRCHQQRFPINFCRICWHRSLSKSVYHCRHLPLPSTPTHIWPNVQRPRITFSKSELSRLMVRRDWMNVGRRTKKRNNSYSNSNSNSNSNSIWSKSSFHVSLSERARSFSPKLQSLDRIIEKLQIIYSFVIWIKTKQRIKNRNEQSESEEEVKRGRGRRFR